MIKAALALAALFLPQAATAQACLTRAELSSLILFSAPTVIDAAAAKCTTTLPATAFLRTGARGLTQRLRAEAQPSAAGIVRVFEKMGGEKIPAGLSADTLQGVIRDVFTAEMTKDIKAGDCAGIDFVVAAMEPIPAANLGNLIGGILALTGASDRQSPFRVCRDPSQ
jgi:hypothetical protein